MRWRFLRLVAIVGLSSTGRAGEDLAKLYPATMSWSQSGLSTTTRPDAVWRLKSFELEFGRDLQVGCDEATVVLGLHGEMALWAVVFPDEPATITAALVPGNGERPESIFVRFAPAEIGKLFPKKTVAERGGTWLRAEATRIFRHKIGWKWSTPSGNTTIVQPGWTIADVETTAGGRHCYGIDRNGGTVEYANELASKPLPELEPIDSERALAVFDEVWSAFDAEYAKFSRHRKLDWRALGDEYRELAGRAETGFELAAVLGDMLARLEDLHVWVRCGDDYVPGYARLRPLNASWKATQAAIGTLRQAGGDLTYGKTEDGIGYLNVTGLGDDELAEHVDEALDVLGDTWGLIVDLRFNGGGDETLAQAIAGRFVDREVVYSTNRYRNGPEHDDLGPVLQRKVGPRGPWRYEAPIVVLIGQKTLSSAESFALMLAECPDATTMGDRTGGSSGNPRLLELDGEIRISLPRWVDMDKDGEPIEGRGIEPDVRVKAEPADFTNGEDPVLEAALKRLRKVSKGRRGPGRG